MVGELIAGRYELRELVGSGGMSKVFKAYDRLLERSVAIKILHEQFGLDDDYVERFRREARAVAQLAHPNIVTVIDRGEEDGRQYIVFEYVEGENLKALVAGGPLAVEEALALTLQVARALDFAHKRGLVHRDVKPQNILLTEEGQAKVTDFGIARSLDVQGVTQTGTVLGTSDYIAPEQARGQDVDQKTDIYSLGAVLYELLTGEVPYPGDNFVAVAMQHVNAPVPSVLEQRAGCPLRLDEAVQRAMAKDPADRYESMDDFVAELEDCLAESRAGGDEGATMIVRRPRRAPVSRPRAPRRRLPVGPTLLALVAAGAIAGAVFLYSAGSDPGGGDSPGERPAQPVRFSGVGAYDPEGGDGEHDEEAPLAVDRNPTTAWRTSRYRYPNGELGKDGVGLVLDAGRVVTLREIVVETDTPGLKAEIHAGDSRFGGFRKVADEQTVDGTATFEIAEGSARYWVVWITNLGPHQQAHVNEVTPRT